MKKNFNKRVAMAVALAMVISTGVQTRTVVRAGGQQQPSSVELVEQADSSVINVAQGKTVNFKIKLSLASNVNINATAKVNTNYHLSKGQGQTVTTASSVLSNPVTLSKNGTVTIDATVNVDNNVPTGNVSVPIYVEISNVLGNNDVPVVNQVIDNFTVSVSAADTVAPVVTITSPTNNGYYKSSALPTQPVYSVVEANSHNESVTGYDKTTEGTHTVTVTSTDASGNVGSASATYTVDNTAPTISTSIVNGGIYNAITLDGIGKYYSVNDANPGTESASALDDTEGDHTATITATDKAGNTATTIIKYTVDNTAPTISFNFDDNGFYKSTFAGFNPYYNVSDDHLKSVSAPELNLSESKHSVTVSASDLAGNSNSASASYTVDDTVPTVTINLDPSKYYNTAALNALGDYYTAADANLADVNADTLEKNVDGSYTASVTATDKAGNSTTESVSYNVDNKSPVISFDSKLQNGGFYQSNALSDIKDNFYTVTEDHLDSKSAVENDTTVDKLDLSDGQHTISVTAKDAAGNATTKSITYTIDDAAPTVGFNITSGSFLTSDNLVKALDSNGKYYTTRDNNSVASVVADELDSTEGTHTLNVTATDAAGNSTTKSITYTIDNTAPTVNFLIKGGSFLTSANLAKALNSDGNYYTASDNNAVANVDADTLKPSDDGTYAEGKYTLSVTAVDAAGNSTTQSVTFTVDNTAPVVSFSIPDKSYLTSSDLTKLLDGKDYYNTSDKNGVVDVNAPTLETSEGPHTLSVTAKDAAGNSTTESVTYTIDNTDPTITAKLADGGIYNADTLKKMGTYYSAQDANLDSVTGTELNYTQGSYKVVITATDKAGNTATQTINYTVDNTAPVITFNFDNRGFYQSRVLGELNSYYNVTDDNLDSKSINAPSLNLNEGLQSVTVSASDLAGNSNTATASYTVDDTAPEVSINLDPSKYYDATALSLLGKYYSATDTNLLNVEASTLTTGQDGTYTATVSATDKAGNRTTESVNYNVDNTNPVITFDSKLQNGGFYQSSTLEGIKGSFYTVTEAHPYGTTAVENGTPVNELDLSDGQHTISVTSVDAAGNTTTESITYTIDNTAPVVTVSGLSDGQRFIVGQNVTVSWAATDTNLDSSTGNSFTLDTTSAGTKTITIPAAVDKAGNVTPAQTLSYEVYNFSGVLQPIKSDNSSSFKLGSTVPVKFQLVDGANYLTDAKATIQLKNVSGAAVAASSVVASTSSGTDGSLFRYDSTGNQYIYNLSTKTLSEGQYKAVITITIDGISVIRESAVFTIKK